MDVVDTNMLAIRSVLDRPWSIGEAVEFVRVLIAMPGHHVLQPSERYVEMLRELTLAG